MGKWTNNDGLTLYYGTDKAAVEPVGEFRFNGPVRCTEIRFASTNLPVVADNQKIISDKYSFPKGANIERVEITSWKTFVGSSSTLNVGTIDLDETSNAVTNSLVDAATIAELNAGGTNVAGWVGSYVDNVPLTTAKYLTWEVDTAAITDGEGIVRVYWTT